MEECNHVWEVEYLPDPLTSGGVIRSGDVICTECGKVEPDIEKIVESLPEVLTHNHFTRDIKPQGKCPACDDYWNR